MRKTLSGVSQKIQKIDSNLRLNHYKIKDFEPNVAFNFERGHFLVKTVENGDELEQCLRLRYEIFHREFLKKKREIGVDIDKLDFMCDHLAILDKRHDNRVIGTYRLNCSRFTDTFYSATEFKIGKLLEQDGHKLELGRACIDKDYRNGVVITLLWRAIAEYLLQTDSKFLFGCASVKTMDLNEAALVHSHLTDLGIIDSEYQIEPTSKYVFPELHERVEKLRGENLKLTEEQIKTLIPPLFASYIKMGVRVCGEPALDKDFQCIDFLTVLKMDELNPLFVRKYKV